MGGGSDAAAGNESAGTSFDWTKFGKGVQGASSGLYQSPNQMPVTQGYYAQPGEYQPAPPFQMISQSSGNNDFAMMLQRLLGGY